MGRIHVLPDSLINRIAAGEVVERPASVVKELVENSIDAGARSVEVVCDAGGRKLIRVVDDGCGMDRDDALLALERHATSKLRDAHDLNSIATLGFRGEALSSIAAVSRFVLRTCTGEGTGIEVEVHGGTIREVRRVGLPRGTTIEAARLFFNVPARRKFLRSEATELGHVARAVTRFALAYPRLRFTLTHGGRRLLRVDPADDPRERIAQIYGRDFSRKLLPFDRQGSAGRIHGFAGRPADSLPRRDGQHVFVNGRAVQDRVLGHAVHEAYGNTMPRGRHASLFLFVDLEPEQVDVNVHPQKTEVRFRNGATVHDAVRDALRGALSHAAVVPRLADVRPSTTLGEPAGLARAVSAYLTRAHDAPSDRGPHAVGSPAAPPTTSAATAPARPTPAAGAVAGPTPGVAAPRLRSLAQYRESYILAQDAEGLVLVDQHAAHERVLFERYLAEAESNRVEVQKLLFPVTVELSPEQRVLLEQEREEFLRLGFVVEPFGGNTVRVDGIPAVAAQVDPESLVRELLGEAVQARSAVAGAEVLRHKLVTSAACQAAIKVNHPLSGAAMQRLLDDLLATISPSTCPHGRPLLFRLTHEEIERAFDRR